MRRTVSAWIMAAIVLAAPAWSQPNAEPQTLSKQLVGFPDPAGFSASQGFRRPDANIVIYGTHGNLNRTFWLVERTITITELDDFNYANKHKLARFIEKKFVSVISGAKVHVDKIESIRVKGRNVPVVRATTTGGAGDVEPQCICTLIDRGSNRMDFLYAVYTGGEDAATEAKQHTKDFILSTYLVSCI